MGEHGEGRLMRAACADRKTAFKVSHHFSNPEHQPEAFSEFRSAQ